MTTVTSPTTAEVAASRQPIDPRRLRELAGPRWSVDCVAETGSTNADLLLAAGSDASSGTGQNVGRVLIAEYQNGGRGRLDRSWTSPAGAGLTMSLLVWPTVATALWGWLPLLTGLALRDAIEDSGGSAALKWPNDLLLGAEHGKVAGILVQVATALPAAGATGSRAAAVLGIGVNVSTAAVELPVSTATSLLLQGCSIDRVALAASVLRHLEEVHERWQNGAGDVVGTGLLRRYRESCTTIGADVMLELASGTAPARALDVDAEGRLLVQVVGEDAPRAVTAGDVTHLRPSSG
jgi:BirA family biotin operon repressor/biotin-[acetyl-CoA-carboxylase] ligase